MKMMWLMLASLLYICLLNIVYYSKKRFSNIENNIFKILLSSNAIGLVIELGCIFFVPLKETYPLYTLIFSKGLLVYYFAWIVIFTLYVFAVCYDKTKTKKDIKQYMKSKYILMAVIFLICAPILFCLPLNYYYDGIKVYSYGTSVNFLNILYTGLICLWVIILLLNFKRIKTKKHLPIFFFIFLGSIVGLIQKAYPHMLLMTSFQTFIVFLMFFTIENPDLQMLFELKKNKYLTQKSAEEKSNLLFNISQEIRTPLESINNVVTESLNKNSKNKDLLKIKEDVNTLNFVVNHLLDISDMEAINIKKTDNVYNINTLLKTLEMRAKKEIKNNVDFRMNVTSDLPEKLIGDESKIKQILTTILLNSVKHTEEGFIEFRVNTIIKYDVVRLIFEIEDSGKGMSLEKVNDLMSEQNELTDEDIKMLDKLNLNINIITKLVKSIGGNILIKSEDGKGTEFRVIIEQKIKDEINSYAEAKYKEYSKELFNEKRVLLISDKKDDVNKITNKLKDNNYEITVLNYAKEAKHKLETEKFDLILIEDEMMLSTAINTLSEIKEVLDLPIVVLLEKNKERIAKAYLSDGFTDTIFKTKFNSELDRIIKKYL